MSTLRNEKGKLDRLTIEGDGVQLVKSIPTNENNNPTAKWTNLVITSSNANSVTTFGATYIMGFQLHKEAVGGSNANWCCLEPATHDNPWVLPQTWIENRNEKRVLPPGMEIERFVSISDSQRNRTNAIVRRMIISLVFIQYV